MPDKKQAKVDIREWLLTPEDQRMPKMSIMKKTGIKDVRTLNNYIEKIQKTLEPDDNYNPDEQFFKNYQRIDNALMKACEKGNAAALKVFYQLSGRLVEKTENLNIDISGDEITRRNLEAERRLRELGYRVEDVPKESALLPENLRTPSGQVTQGNN